MAKQYPLDVMNVGGDEYAVMSKGHHDPETFMREVRAQGYDWPLGKPEHKWVKVVPCGPACGEHRCHYELSDVQRKGWFPATYAWENYCADPAIACGVVTVPDCETCHGEGTIDERLVGYSFSDPAATCPDCNGTGEGPCGVAPSLRQTEPSADADEKNPQPNQGTHE